MLIAILYQIPSSFVAVLIFPYFGYIDSKVYYLEIFVNKFASSYMNISKQYLKHDLNSRRRYRYSGIYLRGGLFSVFLTNRYPPHQSTPSKSAQRLSIL